MKKQRADLLLVARGLAEDQDRAQRLIMAGQVRADGQVVAKASDRLAEVAELAVVAGPRFVSRGGEKLQAALEAFEIPLAGKVCADVGASTGGFTDCLLQHGAASVYAIDTGKGQLDWRLRQDPRVVVMESTNARNLEHLPQAVDLVTIDASFISLRTLLPVVKAWLGEAGDLIALVKPQFEATREEADRGQGVIRDPELHRRVLLEVLAAAAQSGFQIRGLIRSPITGPKGNLEFLLRASLGSAESALNQDSLVAGVLVNQMEDHHGD